MILRAYSLLDVKALQYNPPFFQSTDAVAIRALRDLVNDLNTTVGRHPSDFKLYCIGTFDDATGHFEPLHPMMHVMDALSLVPVSPPSLFDTNIRPDGASVKQATQELAQRALDFAKANGVGQ